MTLPIRFLSVAALLLTTATCGADKSGQGNGAAPTEVSAAPVAAPADGDWSTIVAETPQGGFVMGNPAAKVKLIEYGSMTCSHCAKFEEQGGKALIDNYVTKGLVSFEFRNFVGDPYDITAALVARCGGASSFFGLTRAIYANQKEWTGKIQAADPAQLKALETMAPQAQFKALADIAGFPAFAAMRGVPKAKSEACLADPAAATALVQMRGDAVSDFNISGTPFFVLNGETLEKERTWALVEPKIKAALGN